jgi:hypothetical protein
VKRGRGRPRKKPEESRDAEIAAAIDVILEDTGGLVSVRDACEIYANELLKKARTHRRIWPEQSVIVMEPTAQVGTAMIRMGGQEVFVRIARFHPARVVSAATARISYHRHKRRFGGA